METKLFMNKVLSFARQSLESEALCKDIAPCEQYAIADHERYLEGTFPEADMNAYETHCLDCFTCAMTLVQNHEKVEDGFLFQKTMELLDDLAKERKCDLPAMTEDLFKTKFSIIIEAARDVFRVIHTSGEILTPSAATAVRGDTKQLKDKKPIQIVQEFTQPSVSVQASIVREGPDMAELRISLLNRETEEFMPGVAVRLYAGSDMEEEANTDENGEADFIIHFEHDYTIDLLFGDTRIGRINLSMS